MKYSLKNLWLFTILGIALTTVAGCGKAEKAAPILSPAQERLVQLCTEEYKLNISVIPAQNTTWVYLPVKESFFEFKAEEKKSTEPAVAAKETRLINFFESVFANRDFVIKFDIAKSKQYPKNSGMASSYTEQFQSAQRDLLTAIVRVYGDEPDEKRPQFFVVIIADIVKGLEMRLTFAFADLFRATLDPAFTEEYSRRVIADEAKGDHAIINDTDGRHLAAQNINWPDFLARQIATRVRFKYQRSDFAPKDNDVSEILSAVNATVTAYDFKDFDGVKLKDLSTGKIYDFRKEQLNTFGQ